MKAILYIPVRVPCWIEALSKHFCLMLPVGQFDFYKCVGCLAAFVHNWQIARSLYLDPYFAWHFVFNKMLRHSGKPGPYNFTRVFLVLYPTRCQIYLLYVTLLQFK